MYYRQRDVSGTFRVSWSWSDVWQSKNRRVCVCQHTGSSEYGSTERCLFQVDSRLENDVLWSRVRIQAFILKVCKRKFNVFTAGVNLESSHTDFVIKTLTDKLSSAWQRRTFSELLKSLLMLCLTSRRRQHESLTTLTLSFSELIG